MSDGSCCSTGGLGPRVRREGAPSAGPRWTHKPSFRTCSQSLVLSPVVLGHDRNKSPVSPRRHRPSCHLARPGWLCPIWPPSAPPTQRAAHFPSRPSRRLAAISLMVVPAGDWARTAHSGRHIPGYSPLPRFRTPTRYVRAPEPAHDACCLAPVSGVSSVDERARGGPPFPRCVRSVSLAHTAPDSDHPPGRPQLPPHDRTRRRAFIIQGTTCLHYLDS